MELAGYAISPFGVPFLSPETPKLDFSLFESPPRPLVTYPQSLLRFTQRDKALFASKTEPLPYFLKLEFGVQPLSTPSIYVRRRISLERGDVETSSFPI